MSNKQRIYMYVHIYTSIYTHYIRGDTCYEEKQNKVKINRMTSCWREERQKQCYHSLCLRLMRPKELCWLLQKHIAWGRPWNRFWFLWLLVHWSLYIPVWKLCSIMLIFLHECLYTRQLKSSDFTIHIFTAF